MSTIKLVLEFPNEKERDLFLGWLADGGGEYQFMEVGDTQVNSFDYSRAFPAWGYQPQRDGDPTVVLEIHGEEE